MGVVMLWDAVVACNNGNLVKELGVWWTLCRTHRP